MKPFVGRKVLVVDDDDMLREVLYDMFKNQGAEVQKAENGVVAFALIQKEHFDVVFTDVRMPGGDGITLAKQIAESEGSKPLVFFCSGFNDVTREAAKLYNVIKIYDKPFERKKVLEEIATHLSQVPPEPR